MRKAPSSEQRARWNANRRAKRAAERERWEALFCEMGIAMLQATLEAVKRCDSFANAGAKIGSSLHIRLPVQYTVADRSPI